MKHPQGAAGAGEAAMPSSLWPGGDRNKSADKLASPTQPEHAIGAAADTHPGRVHAAATAAAQPAAAVTGATPHGGDGRMIPPTSALPPLYSATAQLDPLRQASDYGFAGSWDYTGPLPCNPGDVAARVLAAAGQAVAAGEQVDEIGEGSEEDHPSAMRVSSMPDAADVRAVRHSPRPGDVATRAMGGIGRGVGSAGMVGGDHARPASVCVNVGGAAADGGETRGERDTSSRPDEQVSLPEDIYGAARVSEYWQGMHALSSLASAYVYNDIWAGDGGLNPR